MAYLRTMYMVACIILDNINTVYLECKSYHLDYRILLRTLNTEDHKSALFCIIMMRNSSHKFFCENNWIATYLPVLGCRQHLVQQRVTTSEQLGRSLLLLFQILTLG